jgi:hypothetical protein
LEWRSAFDASRSSGLIAFFPNNPILIFNLHHPTHSVFQKFNPN